MGHLQVELLPFGEGFKCPSLRELFFGVQPSSEFSHTLWVSKAKPKPSTYRANHRGRSKRSPCPGEMLLFHGGQLNQSGENSFIGLPRKIGAYRWPHIEQAPAD